MIGFFLIPHWSAVFFVAPLLMVLYIDLLGMCLPEEPVVACLDDGYELTHLSFVHQITGVVQFGGLYINPITYVCLVISIGLLVDL